MNLSITTGSNLAIYEQIVQQIKNEIIAGHLTEGDMLPSIRSLAKELQISVITTKRAYEELEKENLVYTVAGRGVFIARQDKKILREKKITGIESSLTELIRESKKAGLSKEDLTEMVQLLWEED
ncbi:MAG: GntR family transcriptional regulator [Lachnospiraceae bacterium]|nr:GntR family transcriptional regulator [Lachnospiraceae bacterium]